VLVGICNAYDVLTMIGHEPHCPFTPHAKHKPD